MCRVLGSNIVSGGIKVANLFLHLALVYSCFVQILLLVILFDARANSNL